MANVKINHSNEKLLLILMFTLTVSSMSILLFNVVLPLISKEFQLTNSQVSWVISTYSLIYGIGTTIYGKLADHYKLKHLLTFGLLLFSFASLLGFFSTTYWLLLIARCLQATGAAAIPATTMLIPIRYFPAEQRGKAMGTAFAGLALGGALGPVIAALVVSIVDWRWLFCIPLLLLITLPFYQKYLGNEQKYLGDKQGAKLSLDWFGGALLACAVTQLLLGVTNGALWFIGGIIAFVLFIIRIRSEKHPFVHLDLFKNKEYSSYLLLAFFIYAIGNSFFFLSPLLLSEVQKLPASLIGLSMAPAAAAAAILNRQGGKLADKKGSRYLFFTASGLLISCFFLLSTFITSNALFIAFFLMMGYVGQSFMSIVMSKSISLALPKEHTGVGMGLFMMQNFITGSIAIGIYGRMVDIDAHRMWNPFFHSSSGVIYSNIFLILTFIHIVIFMIYKFKMHKKGL
jgi:DHA2 family metal-tetracycline-proton antiporter-like MFS transporter